MVSKPLTSSKVTVDLLLMKELDNAKERSDKELG